VLLCTSVSVAGNASIVLKSFYFNHKLFYWVYRLDHCYLTYSPKTTELGDTKYSDVCYVGRYLYAIKTRVSLSERPCIYKHEITTLLWSLIPKALGRSWCRHSVCVRMCWHSSASHDHQMTSKVSTELEQSALSCCYWPTSQWLFSSILTWTGLSWQR
jgi:hypothetical protein